MKKGNKATVYVLGNPFVEIDSTPIKILPQLQNSFPSINFIEFDPNEDFPRNKEIVIIDSVLGIDKVEVLKDINNVLFERHFSLHDFDLGFQLMVLKKMKRIKDIKIIGIPPEMDEKIALDEVKRTLPSTLTASCYNNL